jgi:hypothetical protein
MDLNQIQLAFNRAIILSFDKRKLFSASIVLALCGLMIVFFRALSFNANQWLLLSFSFLPIFLCTGVLLSAGIFLIRIYHDEIKGKKIDYLDTLTRSWELMIGASYFSIPIILCYLLLWLALGIFVLLKEIPGLGEYIGVLLSGAPFLINFVSLLLTVLNISMLFFVTPVVALNGLNRLRVIKVLVRRLKGDMFSNILFSLIATFPLLFCVALLTLSAVLTGSVCFVCGNPLYVVLQWFFIMIPFAILLSPALIFFFNFSAEAHVMIQKKLKASGDF